MYVCMWALCVSAFVCVCVKCIYVYAVCVYMYVYAAFGGK